MKFSLLRRKVKYYETDKMGIVHHSNYIRWFEEARVDFLEKVGYPFDKMEADGILMPVLEVNCVYKFPARFGDEVEIKAEITEFNGCRLTVKYSVVNLTYGGKLCVTGYSKHCITDSNMKPIRTNHSHPKIYEVFAKAAEEC